MTIDTLWQIFGWVAAILNVAGNLALTTKGKIGWVIRIACNLCWMPYGVYTHAWALIANHVLFVAINCYGWWKWNRDELSDRTAGDVPRTRLHEREKRQAYTKGFNDGRIAERRSRRFGG